MQPRFWHYWIGLLLCAALVPVLRSQNLPLNFDWISLGVAYWLVLSAQSIFLAVILAVIGLPGIWQPFIARYRESPLRILILLIYFGILIWAAGWVRALVLTVDAIALLELRERQSVRRATAIFAPAAYLFVGFLMVLAYNSAIVSARYNFAYDPALGAVDRFLLLGHSVSEIAHWAVGIFSLSFFRALEFIYFGMFPQIGAAMILLAVCNGKKRALQFAGTILLAYYFALALFYLWPSQGPYYLCPEHFSRFPAALQAYSIQKALIAHALARWHHEPLARISTDYFIGLPCMHVAQPLVVLWFVRRWRRMAIALAAYDLMLVGAVVLLEWHYVADILAGIVVAAIAIAITEGRLRRKDKDTESAPQPAGAAG
jgi:PAP2 superfamily